MPHVIVTAQIRIETGPTYVGDEHSDPELMLKLEADKFKEPGNNFFVYRSKLLPRQILDRLEYLGYRIAGVAGIGQTCMWTLFKESE